MAFLIDTNILLRSIELSHPMYCETIKAIITIKTQEKIMYISP